MSNSADLYAQITSGLRHLQTWHLEITTSLRNLQTYVILTNIKAGRTTYINYIYVKNARNFMSLTKRKLLNIFVIILTKHRSSFDFRVYKDQEMLSNSNNRSRNQNKQISYRYVVKHNMKREIQRPQNAIKTRKYMRCCYRERPRL